MYLVGTVTLSKVVEKEWEGRKYYKCQALGSDKEIYSLTLNGARHLDPVMYIRLYLSLLIEIGSLMYIFRERNNE